MIATCMLVLTALLGSPMAAVQCIQEHSVDSQQQPVAEAILQGAVRDSSGRPIGGACVSLQTTNGSSLTAYTDSAGVYLFSGVRQGVYTLGAEMAGYDRTILQQIVIGQKQSRTIDLTLNPAKAIPDKSSAAVQPPFFDEPHFTVAGVTDTTNLGGHGSDTMVRNREALAQATASLSKETPRNSSGDASDATEESLHKRVASQPQDFDANYRMGKLLVDGAKAQDGLLYLQRAFRLNPGAFDNAYELARAYSAIGDYAHARTDALSLLASEDKSLQEKAELHHLLAEIDEKGGDPLEAVREYRKAAELNPSETNLFDWGAELLIHHAPEPAIEVFTKGNHRFPRSDRMLAGLGAAWYSRGSFDQAAQRFCEASDLNPENPNPYLLMGKMQAVETGQSQEIQSRLGRFVKLEPDNALANYYYAVSLWRQRKSPEDFPPIDEVKSLLEKSVHLDPQLGLGYLQLGIIYSEQKDIPKAISALQQAVEVSPQLEQAHYRLAQLYRQSGDSAEAHSELQLYEQISAEKTQEMERERHEMQQFVYQMR
jgi:tetratricopeptide (TPR) repeat protein